MSDDETIFYGPVNTKIACLTCRDKKLKCDKLLPICSRCKQKGIDCIYINHKKTGPKPTHLVTATPSNGGVSKRTKHDIKRQQIKEDNAPIKNDDDNDNDNDGQINEILDLHPEQMAFPLHIGVELTSPAQGSPLPIDMGSFIMDSATPSEARPPTPGIIQQHKFTKVPKISELVKININLEESLKLDELNLTFDDIDKFHQFYFNSNIRPFNYSVNRYFNWISHDFDHVFHYTLMIWAIGCFYIDGYSNKSEYFYELALNELNIYWESTKDSFSSEILPYFHSLCLKAQYEFMTGREMRAALTISSAIRLSQMFGYDQIDLSQDMLSTPTIFFKSYKNVNENILLQDDNLDFDIPLTEERRRVLWEIYVLDKWSSLVSGLPCALSVDNHSVIFTKLPSPTTFLPLQNDNANGDKKDQTGSRGTNGGSTTDDDNKSSFYLHEAMAKLDRNQVLIDINSSSSKVLLLTISENIIKWCKMFLNMVELDSLKSDQSIDSIRNKVNELVKNFESMHNNLLFFDLTTEPLMNIVITNTTTLLYQSVLIKFSSLFDLQLKDGSIISIKEIQLFNDLLTHVSSMSSKLVLKFINKPKMDYHLKKVPIFIVLLNSIKSLFQCAAFYKRFNTILNFNKDQIDLTLNTLKLVNVKFNSLDSNLNSSVIDRIKLILKTGDDLLNNNPDLLSFFDSFNERP